MAQFDMYGLLSALLIHSAKQYGRKIHKLLQYHKKKQAKEAEVDKESMV